MLPFSTHSDFAVPGLVNEDIARGLFHFNWSIARGFLHASNRSTARGLFHRFLCGFNRAVKDTLQMFSHFGHCLEQLVTMPGTGHVLFEELLVLLLIDVRFLQAPL